MTILCFCEPTDVRSLWNEFDIFMVEDYTSTSTYMGINVPNMLLMDLNDILIQQGKTIKDFDLPTLTFDAF